MSVEVKWKSGHGAVGPEVVTAIERELGIQFPADYVECAILNHGATPSLTEFPVQGRNSPAVFNRLLSFHPEKSGYIVRMSLGIRDRMQDGIHPFASDVFGNFLCFDYRTNRANPSIVFWDHEMAQENPEKALFRVCARFTELVDMLYESPDDM